MNWIQVHTNLPRHAKTLLLQQRLKLSTPQALGHLLLLWTWALENSPDGGLGRLDAKGLARTCQFSQRRAEEFLEALVDCGFLDRDERGLSIHDWGDYAGRYSEMRRKNSERQKRYRDCHRYVGVTDANVTGLEERREQDRREQERSGQDRNDASSGAGAGDPSFSEDMRARAELLGEDFAYGLLPPVYSNADPAERRRSDALCEELFRAYCTRPPTEDDRARVFHYATTSRVGEPIRYDEAKAGLLHYAFEQAVGAGRAGVWSYIAGVLRRLWLRDIDDREAAEDYDSERGKL